MPASMAMLKSTASVLAGELVPTRSVVNCATEICGAIRKSATTRNAQAWSVDGERRFIAKGVLAAVSTLELEQFHTKEVLFKTKPTHMQGAPKPIMEEILNRCDAVITGLGA